MEIEITEVEILKSEKLGFFARFLDALIVVVRAFLALVSFFIRAPPLFVGSLLTIPLILAALFLFWVVIMQLFFCKFQNPSMFIRPI